MFNIGRNGSANIRAILDEYEIQPLNLRCSGRDALLINESGPFSMMTKNSTSLEPR